jgi:hypothetical protein
VNLEAVSGQKVNCSQNDEECRVRHGGCDADSWTSVE